MTVAHDYASHLNSRAMSFYRPPSPPIQTILTMLTLAAKLNPGSDEIQANIGLVNWNHGSLDKGREAFTKASILNPSPLNYHLLSIYHTSIGDFKQARTCIDEAIRLDPSNADYRFDRANLLLMQGDWEAGLKEYDVRLESKTLPFPKLPTPLWNGKDDLNGKTLFVQAEQGIGDHILFSRYLTWVKNKYPDCRILFCLHPDIIPLFWGFRDVVEFIPTNTTWPQNVDYGCFLISLARHHGTTPDNIPQDPGLILSNLLATNRRCTVHQPPVPSIKVAVCWSGTHEGNIARNIPLPQILRLAEDPRVTLYSVQCGPGRGEIERHAAQDLLVNVGASLEPEGWMATAAALREFDVIVTCCTAVAHLAGALGLPCWTLLCQQPFWVWPRDSEMTAWYPSMRLFRQKRLNDWTDVIDRVSSELAKLADQKVHYV